MPKQDAAKLPRPENQQETSAAILPRSIVAPDDPTRATTLSSTPYHSKVQKLRNHITGTVEALGCNDPIRLVVYRVPQDDLYIQNHDQYFDETR